MGRNGERAIGRLGDWERVGRKLGWDLWVLSHISDIRLTTRRAPRRRIAMSPFRPFAVSPLRLACNPRSTRAYSFSMPENSAPVARSSTVEDYLEQILDLINTKGYARVADIALGLKISQASVTNMVQRLDSEGLLKYEKYRGLVLTTAGETLARNIMQRHQLLTDFLRMLGIDEEVIYHDVEGMEHHISPQTLRAIEALVSALQEKPELLARIKHQARGN